jgi:hypothetical protein
MKHVNVMKTGTLPERLQASLKVTLEVALQALARQAGQPTRPCLWESPTTFHGYGGVADADLLWRGLDPKPFQAAAADTGVSLPILDTAALAVLLRGRPRLHGGEHEVWFCDEVNLAVKLTNAGEFGAEKLGLPGYARRLAWANELFEDDIRLLGRVLLPGENGERVVTTQPWYRADGLATEGPHPTQKDIDLYMRHQGFLKAYDGAYLHEARDIVASDALPKNFILDAAGHVHAVDIVLVEPSSRQSERLMTMVASQIQVT